MTFNFLLNKKIREINENYTMNNLDHKRTFVYYCNKDYQMSVVLCSYLKELCNGIDCNLIIRNIDYTSDQDEFLNEVIEYNKNTDVDKIIIGVPLPNAIKYSGYKLLKMQDNGELENVLFLQLFSESHIDYMLDLKEFYSSLMLLILA